MKTVAGLNFAEMIFLSCAIVGGLVLLIRIILQFAGISHDFDTDIHDGIDAPHDSTDASFKLLTLQGITAFFMMFGLVGFALYSKSSTGAMIAIIGGTAAGLAAVWIIGRIFSSAMKLQSSGTIGIDQAVGCTGTVYMNIPEDGIGRVQINLKNRLREFDARSADSSPLLTGSPIKVTGISANVLIVEKN